MDFCVYSLERSVCFCPIPLLFFDIPFILEDLTNVKGSLPRARAGISHNRIDYEVVRWMSNDGPFFEMR